MIVGANGKPVGETGRFAALLEMYRTKSLDVVNADAILFRSLAIKDQLELLFFMVTNCMVDVRTIQQTIADAQDSHDDADGSMVPETMPRQQ